MIWGVLASIKPGDIVRVHDGLPYFAEVIERGGTLVRVAPITGPRGVRTVTSREVVLAESGDDARVRCWLRTIDLPRRNLTTW